MSKQMKGINLQKLATNFAQEKSKDERYWQRNDAKFRAVHQRCTNYDEFRQIVDAAHLRPLDRNETLTLERQSIAWNQAAAKQPSSDVSISSEASNRPSAIVTKPRNQTELLQQWRRLSDETKMEYLHQLDHLESLFQIDVPTDLLDELPVLYQSDSSVNDADMLVNLLVHIGQSKRFELMKSFLSEERKHQLDRLFSRLCSFVHLRFPVFLLRMMYL